MKKGILGTLCAALTAFVLAFALVGCGGGSAGSAPDNKAAFVGVWELDSMTEDGEETNGEDLDLVKSLGLNVFLLLNEDGSASLNMFGEDLAGASWKVTSASEASITFEEDDEEQTVALKLADGKLTMEQDGSTLGFAKSTKEAMDEFAATASGLADLLDDDEEEDEGEDEDIVDEVEEAASALAASSREMDSVIVDDDYVKLTVTSLEANGSGRLEVNINVENKTDQDLELFEASSNQFQVNGVTSDPILATFVSAGETIDDYIAFTDVAADIDLETVTVSGAIEVDDTNYDALETFPFEL